MEDAGGLLFFAVVSHRNEDDGLTVFQGRVVDSQRFSLECPTALQHPERTHPETLSSALKVKQSGSFRPAEHIHSGRVEPRVLQLGECRRDSCEVVEDRGYSVHRIPVEVIHIEPPAGC